MLVLTASVQRLFPPRALGLAVPALMLVVGCVQSPRVYRIVGPDGSPMLHVSCGSEQGQCYEVAGLSCPGGYDLYPVLSPASGNFLVRCRLPVPPATHVAERAPSAPLETDWPPPNEPWQAESPWTKSEVLPAGAPATQSGATPGDASLYGVPADGAPGQVTPVSLRPIGEQDIGY